MPDVGSGVRVHFPPGSLIRSTIGRHKFSDAAGQDAAHSQPSALAAATTGVGSGWVVQVAP